MPSDAAAFALSPVGVEALDDPATDPALVTRMLRDIARSNRWLGGAAAARYGLSQLLGPADRGRTLTLFDIGTGAGDLPRDAVRWAARRGVTLVPLGLERIPAAAALAQRNGVPVVLGCAGVLPLRAKSVDLVLVSQVAHHLDRASAMQLVAACQRLARRGVILADLHRRWFAAPGFRLAGRVLGLHPATIDDGITSLRRGYTAATLRALCVEAGIANVHVTARPGARVVAWWSNKL
jgi:SAM-dependent methyltransferase